MDLGCVQQPSDYLAVRFVPDALQNCTDIDFDSNDHLQKTLSIQKIAVEHPVAVPTSSIKAFGAKIWAPSKEECTLALHAAGQSHEKAIKSLATSLTCMCMLSFFVSIVKCVFSGYSSQENKVGMD